MEELGPWEDGKKDALPVHVLGVAWRAELEGQNMLLLLLLQVWHEKGFTTMAAHTILVTSFLVGLSLLTQPLPGIYLCPEKRMGPSIFSSFSSSSYTGVASSCPCWCLGALMARSLLDASSEVISHRPLLPTPLPGFTAVSQAAPASVLCCCSQTRSVILVLYLLLRVVADYEEPLLLFPPPEMDFSRAHPWPQVVCGRKSWSCWIFGFVPKKACLPWDLFLKSYQFLRQPTALIFWITDQLPRGHVVLQVEWDEYSSPSQSDCIPSVVR